MDQSKNQGRCMACLTCISDEMTHWCPRCKVEGCDHGAVPGHPAEVQPILDATSRPLSLLPGWEDYVDDYSDADPGL